MLKRHPLVQATFLGALSILAFVAVLQSGKSLPSAPPAEAAFRWPCIVLTIATAGWMAAYQLGLRHRFLIGAVLPIALAAGAVGTGTLLAALRADPVTGAAKWIGWGAVALMFYPAVAVWFLSPQRRTRFTVFSTALAMFGGMLFYTWSTREQWRFDYYAREIPQEVVTLLDVPGFHLDRLESLPLIYSAPRLRYLLVGDPSGPFPDAQLKVEASLGPRSEDGTSAVPVSYPSLPGCRAATVPVAAGRLACFFHSSPDVSLFYAGTVFEIEGITANVDPATIARIASAKRWSRHDLRYIPVGTSPPSLSDRLSTA